MAEQSGNTLQHVEQFLREGKKQEALPLLAEYLRQHPNSAHGWWLLSFAVPDAKRQIECVERVLRIDLNSTPARARLETLKSNISVQKPVSPFIDTISSKLADISDQLPKQDSLPSASRKTARHRKTNSQFLQYAVLAVLGCVAVSVFAFASMMIVQGYSGLPMRSVESAPFTQISLPPTWTPIPTATRIATQTPFLTITPLGMPALDILPTNTIPKSQIDPAKGSYAPDFSLTNVNSNQQVKLSDYEGQAVVIFFWATWCQYCKAEMPTIQMIYQTYQDEGLVVLAIDVGESAAQARKYRDAHSLTFPILDDAGRDVSSKYRVTTFPTLFFVDPSGVISSTKIGVLDYWGFNKKVRIMLNLAP